MDAKRTYQHMDNDQQRNLPVSLHPFDSAKCKGVNHPQVVLAFTLAPLSRSSLHMSVCPSSAALCSIVHPDHRVFSICRDK